ncbi:MAG: PaaI family thioesterase [Anaerotignum sp.]|nr:PaaI family thioesterase [Anaerotignum sp.]
MMKWNERPELSQKDMEQWFQSITGPEAALQHHGVIPKMKPRFIACDFERGTAEMAYEVLSWELNPQDMIHGGITSTALDTSLGMLTHYYTKPHVLTTVTMSVTFLKPILLGDTFHIHSRLESLGRTLSTVTGEVRLERDNILAATCTATYKIMHQKQKNPLV